MGASHSDVMAQLPPPYDWLCFLDFFVVENDKDMLYNIPILHIKILTKGDDSKYHDDHQECHDDH